MIYLLIYLLGVFLITLIAKLYKVDIIEQLEGGLAIILWPIGVVLFLPYLIIFGPILLGEYIASKFVKQNEL